MNTSIEKIIRSMSPIARAEVETNPTLARQLQQLYRQFPEGRSRFVVRLLPKAGGSPRACPH